MPPLGDAELLAEAASPQERVVWAAATPSPANDILNMPDSLSRIPDSLNPIPVAMSMSDPFSPVAMPNNLNESLTESMTESMTVSSLDTDIAIGRHDGLSTLCDPLSPTQPRATFQVE